jgi:hypothetical protein
MRGNRSLRGSQPPSPSGSEDDNDSVKSPTSAIAAEEKTPIRGRKGKIDGADAMDV